MQKISRAEWGARSPKAQLLGINTQSGTAHWEGTTMGIFAHESCATKVRAIQAFHMDSRGWSDIAYNFVVCPHGFVYIGRDHGIRSAANGTNESNAVSEAVCYMSGVGDPFTLAGQSAMAEILNEISSEHHCHREWFNTACPGDEICGWVQTDMPGPYNVAPTPTPVTDNSFPDYPLPSSDWYGKPDRNPHNHSGYYNPMDMPAISLIQQIGRDHGHAGLKVDGFFGQATTNMVFDLQAYFGLNRDGLVGPNTWSVLALVNGS